MPTMRIRSVRRILVPLAVILGMGTLAASQGPASQRSLITDVLYANPGGVSLTLDVYTPAGTGPFPAVVLIHPGTWKSGNKEHMAPYAQSLADAGFVAFSINFRLDCNPKKPPADVLDPALCGYHAPEEVADVHSAVAWVRTNAAVYNVDTTRIGALGSSSGGNLAMMLGDSVNRVVAWSGRGDFPLSPSSGPLQRYVGCLYGDCPNKWEAASPVYLLPPAPLLLTSATGDGTVPIADQQSVNDHYTTAGIMIQWDVVDAVCHGAGCVQKFPWLWDDSLAWLEAM